LPLGLPRIHSGFLGRKLHLLFPEKDAPVQIRHPIRNVMIPTENTFDSRIELQSGIGLLRDTLLVASAGISGTFTVVPVVINVHLGTGL
jgi:hypothetical protein